MGKINKIKIINLNYNNNSIKIDDLKFFLDSDDTMFNLRNGGGKSVLVQMIMAPLVHKKYRDLKDRKFESYFTKSVPTYILIEWELDNEAGFVTTGMMVRKKEGSLDEETIENLDIVNFIHEYKYKNENDIDNLTLIEELNGNKRIKSYANAKKLFEDLKKSCNGNFSYYDMNNSYNSTSYFNKLSTYNINYKEWENIIHKINLKESGLSELFAKAKNVEGLLKEWFLPAVEEKLTKDENRIKNFRIIANGYINQYKENKSKLEKKKKIELFNSIAEELKETAEELINIKEDKEKLENEIANIREYLKSERLNNEEEIKKLDNLLRQLQDELNDIKYERLSLEIYKEKDKKNGLTIDLDKYKGDKEREIVKVNELERQKNILTCAKYYEEYTEASQELQELEIQKKNLTEENNSNQFKLDDIGFSIRKIIEVDKKSLDINIEEREKECNLYQVEIEETNKQISKIIEEAKSLKEKKGSLLSKVNSFNKEEEKFNRDYKEKLSRNLEGLYLSDTLLNLEKQTDDLQEGYNKKFKEIIVALDDNNEKRKIAEGKREDKITKAAAIEASIKLKGEELDKLNNEIEKRKELIRYVDLKEHSLFDKMKIVSAFDGKINVIKEKRNNVNKAMNILNEELTMLKTGKLLELPKELEGELKSRGISIVYGMEWLKKNGYSEEENLKIIDNNPFIPYSLIMDSRDFEILSKEPLKIYTSTPIIIVKRESINSVFKFSKSGVIQLEGIDLLVSFNKKLINEEELNFLINNKELQLAKLEENDESLNKDISFFEDKRNLIYYSELSEEGYKCTKEELEEFKKQEKSLEEELRSLKIEISDISSIISKLENDKVTLSEKIKFLNRKGNAYKEFKKEYHDYKSNKEKYEVNEEMIKVNDRENSRLKLNLEDLEGKVCDVTKTMTSIRNKARDLNNELKDFNIFTQGTFIDKDKEDLLAQYRVLKDSIDKNLEQIEESMKRVNSRHKRVTDELVREARKSNLVDVDYTSVKYTLDKMDEVENLINKQREVVKIVEDRIIKNESEQIKVDKDIEHKYKKLLDECKKENLKPKDLIIIKDYDEAEAKVNLKLEDTNKQKGDINKLNNKLDTNIGNLSEHDELEIKVKIDVQLDFDNLNSEVGSRKRDLRKLNNEEKDLSNRFKREIDNKLSNKKTFSEDQSFKDIIVVIYKLSDTPKKMLEQLKIYEESFSMQMLKLSQDIEMIDKEELKILENMLDYIKEVNENLDRIDNNSSITIKEKNIKMLNVKVPNWEENLEIYKLKLKNYLQQLRDQALVLLNKNESIEDIISNRITNYNLFNEVVSVSSVNIKLYKIEEDKQRQISWNEVSTNSGGEGFLSAFVILSSLLSYIRKDSNDIFNKSESGKVLVMDNPFAQTSSVHLLKPLMDIAKKTNTQLICFTALGDDAIYNRFDNIYVLNTIQSKLKSGIKYMRSNHIKGSEEEPNILVSSRLKIEDQMRLF
ncbi:MULTISPECIES: hypothetical protein [unclassified Clostridium]|uniref:hypothetical protein n=1 Tax=unclassified Clostridium TaxID=2614128 RepID=UPI0032178B35